MKCLFSSSRSYSSASFVILSFFSISERYNLDFISEPANVFHLVTIQEVPPLSFFINNFSLVFMMGFLGRGT